MKYIFFTLVLLAVAVFIEATGQSLPGRVASHFAAGGDANGFMPRDAYVRFMTWMAVGVPFLVALIHRALRHLPPSLFNLPHRDYWFAAERKDVTLHTLEKFGVTLAAFMAVFFAYVHWMVVRANSVQPPHLPNALFFSGMIGFLVGVIGWSVALVLRFRRP